MDEAGAPAGHRLNLATRCPACSTVFRVVQDQLKVSDGWVRCGHCDEVFNAIDTLIDLDRDPWPEAPPADPPPRPVPHGAAPLATAPTPPDSPPVDADRIDPESIEPRFDSAAADPVLDFGMPVPRAPEHPRERPAAPSFAAAPPRSGSSPGSPFDPSFDAPFDEPPAPPPRASAADLRASQLAELDDTLGAREPLRSAPAAHDETPPAAASAPVLHDDPPEPLDPVTGASALTIGHADEPPAFSRTGMAPTPRRRASAGGFVAAALLLALLGLQAAFHHRDALAARVPALRPAFEAACAPLGCRLGAPRRIEDIAVENTGLVRTALPGAFQLAVGLRNRGNAPVALPSIELTLTDPNGQLLARRALAPSDFTGAPTVLRAGGDVALQVLLATPGPRVSGYTVEIYYP